MRKWMSNAMVGIMTGCFVLGDLSALSWGAERNPYDAVVSGDLAEVETPIKVGATVKGETESDKNMERKISILLDKLILHKSDIAAGGGISQQKRDQMRDVSMELTAIGIPAIPSLIEMTGLAYSSEFCKSETGWAAARVLMSIGPSALPYLENADQGAVTRHIIQEIKKRNSP